MRRFQPVPAGPSRFQAVPGGSRRSQAVLGGPRRCTLVGAIKPYLFALGESVIYGGKKLFELSKISVILLIQILLQLRFLFTRYTFLKGQFRISSLSELNKIDYFLELPLKSIQELSGNSQTLKAKETFFY